MIKCNDECQPICDFCVWFDYNGDEDGAYTNNGMCRHPEHIKPTDISNYCNDYECFRAAEANQEALKRCRENRVLKFNIRKYVIKTDFKFIPYEINDEIYIYEIPLDYCYLVGKQNNKYVISFGYQFDVLLVGQEDIDMYFQEVNIDQ